MYLLRKNFPDSLIFTFLVIIGIKISYLSEKVTDLNNFDESIYLLRGTVIDPTIKSNIDGFLYYLWYKFLSLFTGNNTELYFLNNSILLVLPGLMLFIFLRVVKINLLISFLSASIFIISTANVFAVPFITKFALCVTIAGLTVIYKTKIQQKKLLYFVFLSVMLLYVRPEFFITLSLASAVYIIYIFKYTRFRNKRQLIKNLSPVILIFLLIVFFNPVSRHRANVAFVQHYTRDISERERNSTPDSEIAGNPSEIMKEDFNTESSMFNAFINNPGLVFEHIGFNIIRLNEHIKDTFPYFLIQSKQDSMIIIFYCLAILLLILSTYFIVMRIRKKKSGLFSLICLLLVFPSVISVLIFYPRVHYVIIIFAFILIYISYEISNRLNSYEIVKKLSFPVSIICGILFLIAVPFRANAKSIHEISCTQFNTVKSLNKLNFKNNVNFFAVGPGIFTYLESNWKYVSDDLLEKPVGNFINKNNINLILIDSYFLNHPLIKNNSEIDNVLNDTAFVKINIPGCFSYLLARKDFLK